MGTSGEWAQCAHSPHNVCVIYRSNLQRNIRILCEALGITPDDGVGIGAETCRV
jgi:hypothetical protein